MFLHIFFFAPVTRWKSFCKRITWEHRRILAQTTIWPPLVFQTFSKLNFQISLYAKYSLTFDWFFVQNFDGLCFELGALINTSSGRVRPPWANCHTRAVQPPLPISNYYYLSVVKFTIILSLLTVKYPDLLVFMTLNNFWPLYFFLTVKN